MGLLWLYKGCIWIEEKKTIEIMFKPSPEELAVSKEARQYHRITAQAQAFASKLPAADISFRTRLIPEALISGSPIQSNKNIH